MTKSNTTSLGATLRVMAFVVFVQALRILLKYATFLILPHTIFYDTMFAVVFRIAFVVVLLIVCSKKGIKLNIFPRRFDVKYIIISLVFTAILVSTPFFNRDFSVSNLLNLFYAAIVTPVFEELIFRGYIWETLKKSYKREIGVFIAVTLLFSVWHLGFFDTVSWRMAQNGSSGNLINVMLWKTAVGFLYGAFVGAVRLRMKNCYSCMVIHGAANMFAP